MNIFAIVMTAFVIAALLIIVFCGVVELLEWVRRRRQTAHDLHLKEIADEVERKHGPPPQEYRRDVIAEVEHVLRQQRAAQP